MSQEAEARDGMRGEAERERAIKDGAHIKGSDAWPLTAAMRAAATNPSEQRKTVAARLQMIHAAGKRSCAFRDLRTQDCNNVSEIHALSWLGVLHEARTTEDIPFLKLTPYTRSWCEFILAEVKP